MVSASKGKVFELEEWTVEIECYVDVHNEATTFDVAYVNITEPDGTTHVVLEFENELFFAYTQEQAENRVKARFKWCCEQMVASILEVQREEALAKVRYTEYLMSKADMIAEWAKDE